MYLEASSASDFVSFTNERKLSRPKKNSWSDDWKHVFSPSFGAVSIGSFSLQIDNMCKDVPLTKPEKSPHAKEWDGMTVETFKNQTLWTSSMLHFSLMIDLWFNSQIIYCNLLSNYQLHHKNFKEFPRPAHQAKIL